MSAVDFHTHLADPIQYACRLLRKVLVSGAWAEVRGSFEVLQRLDTALWTFSALDFLPHAGPNAIDAVRRRSPVSLLDDNMPFGGSAPSQQARTVLVAVNGGFDPAHPWVAQHPRVLELVGNGQAELAQARQRFRSYRNHADGAHTLTIHEKRA